MIFNIHNTIKSQNEGSCYRSFLMTSLLFLFFIPSFLEVFPFFPSLFVFHFHLQRGQNEKWWSDAERTQERQSAKSNFLSKYVCQLQSAEGQVDNKSLTLNRQVALWLIHSSSSQAERKVQTKPAFSKLQRGISRRFSNIL